jgi:hypothetical protein
MIAPQRALGRCGCVPTFSMGQTFLPAEREAKSDAGKPESFKLGILGRGNVRDEDNRGGRVFTGIRLTFCTLGRVDMSDCMCSPGVSRDQNPLALLT